MSLPIPVADIRTAAPHPLALLDGIAAQLSALAIEAEDFGVALCSDPAVAGTFLVQLQQIDKLSQSLREVARVLSATDPQAAVADIRLGDLRSALEAAVAR
jgi:hypothetical protein